VVQWLGELGLEGGYPLVAVFDRVEGHVMVTGGVADEAEIGPASFVATAVNI